MQITPSYPFCSSSAGMGLTLLMPFSSLKDYFFSPAPPAFAAQGLLFFPLPLLSLHEDYKVAARRTPRHIKKAASAFEAASLPLTVIRRVICLRRGATKKGIAKAMP